MTAHAPPLGGAVEGQRTCRARARNFALFDSLCQNFHGRGGGEGVEKLWEIYPPDETSLIPLTVDVKFLNTGN